MKTIDLTVKTWRDKVNGNNYVSGRIVIDYAMETERTLVVPFQYGDYLQSEYEATKVLRNTGMLEDNYSGHLSTYCHEHRIVYRFNHQENCLQRDVKAFGRIA